MADTYRVLIVEDQADIRRLVRWALKPYAYEIFEAANGEKGLAAAVSTRPDLVLLDVMMPGIDGYEVCRRLRADAEFGTKPIVMLTAQSRDRDRDIAIEAGATSFLRKPFSPAELGELVERLLSTSRSAELGNPSPGNRPL